MEPENEEVCTRDADLILEPSAVQRATGVMGMDGIVQGVEAK